jgi:putative radical SAM enzyme (TIGR03279 family)
VKKNGLKIKTISADSVFYQTGMQRGDSVISVNGETIEDELDFRFFTAENHLEVEFLHNGNHQRCSLVRPDGVPTGVEFYENPINRCRNRCIFCFIDQMPPGLRKSLYIKDEDVKHSFVNGNYVTMTSLTRSDLEKTVQLGISPLFISVHATDHSVRTLMLGNKKAPPVLSQLKFLTENGIMLHTQIVVCPGYNDGEVLEKTISDILELGQCVRSVAVVPVGITRFRKNPLRMVDSESAKSIISIASEIDDKYVQREGFRRLFCADELYIKARKKIPPHRYYEDFPQKENGVGLIRMQFENWRSCRRELQSGKRRIIKKQRVLVVCSISAFQYIKDIISEIMSLSDDLLIDITAVENSFFGTTVTVAGLLTAKDVLPALKKQTGNYNFACLPSVMFNVSGTTIDGYSIDRMMKMCGMKIKCAEYISDLFSIKK